MRMPVNKTALLASLTVILTVTVLLSPRSGDIPDALKGITVGILLGLLFISIKQNKQKKKESSNSI